MGGRVDAAGASGRSSCRCRPMVVGRAVVGAAGADLVGEALAEAAGLEGSAEVVASAVVAVAPVGEIQSRDAADPPSVFGAVRNG